MVTVSVNPTYPTNPTTINSGELTDKNRIFAVGKKKRIICHHFPVGLIIY